MPVQQLMLSFQTMAKGILLSWTNNNNNNNNNNISVSAAEMRSPSSTLLTPIRRRCSHTLLRTVFKACGFVLLGEKILI